MKEAAKRPGRAASIPWNPAKKSSGLSPESPGVYLFKDAAGKVVYVGKGALRCGNRVRSYFLESRWVDAKTGSLAREIADLETILGRKTSERRWRARK